jgi:hypothetical protein
VTHGRIELKRLHYLAVPLRFNHIGDDSAARSTER